MIFQVSTQRSMVPLKLLKPLRHRFKLAEQTNDFDVALLDINLLI